MGHFALLAPFAAWSRPLTEAPDEAFSAGLLGGGIALDPLEGMVRAPCDAEVIAIAPTRHSITLRHESGAELLIHVGIDTVELAGRGFEILVSSGAKVSAGDPLLTFDLDAVARGAKSVITPVVLLSENFQVTRPVTGVSVQPGEEIARIEALAVDTGDAGATTADDHTASCTVRVPLANGLHARPSARIVAALKPWSAEVRIRTDAREANARSVTALLKLDVRHGDQISIEARGPDADAALEALASLLLTGMPDEETHVRPPEGAGDTLATAAGTQDDGLSPTIPGIRAAPGGARGVAFQLSRRDRPVPQTGGSPAEERGIVQTALRAVRSRLEDAARHNDIADAHLAIVNDPALAEAVDGRIAAGASAAYAWRTVTREEIDALRATGNPLLMERAADLLDVERQLIGAMFGEEAAVVDLPDAAILITDELLPSEFLKLDLGRLAGIATAGGGPTSHVAILAGSNGIPMLVSCGPRILDIPDATPLLIDFDHGQLHVDPDEAVLTAFSKRAAERAAQAQADALAAAEDCRTADGRRIEIFANCGSATDALAAVKNGAEGCGLLRTEFLFLGRHSPPSREEQALSYGEIAKALDNRPLIVRTLDAGSDKPLAYLPMPAEENPALGTRGIRLSLARPDLLEDQFLAILQGVPPGQCRIMLPMVVDLSELRAARTMLRKAEAHLGLDRPTPLGIMVETPAAALLADQLAREADFLSIGSNDLTQYALAADRQNPAVASAADALHPAVLRLIKASAEGAHAHGRWLGVCGSIASDPEAAALLIGLGVDELSATPTMVPALKARVRTLTVKDCTRLAETALQAASAQEVRQLVEEARHAPAL